jgi:SEC-C motif-containing protein
MRAYLVSNVYKLFLRPMLNNQSLCPCGSNEYFDKCCLPLIQGTVPASSPERLMRSRYSAYVSNHYTYIFDTYTKAQRKNLTVADIAASADSNHWLKLEVLSAFEDSNKGEVEFIAFYELRQNELEQTAQKTFYAMHERSRFVKEDGAWRYADGDMLLQTGKVNLTRNQTCLCGSKLKFKKCCGK